MSLEFKTISITDIKAAEDGSMIIEGYASTFGNKDQSGDVVMKGAFLKSLMNVKKIKMLYQHNTKEVIGTWLEMREDEKGLYVKGQLLDIPDGEKVYKMIKAGALDSFSIGFITKEFDYDSKKRIRYIKQCDLMEVSVVTFPMNESAVITGVKSMPSVREFEQIMQDAGLSRSQARIVINTGYKSLISMQDAGDEDKEEQLKNALLKNINTLKIN